MSAVAVVGPGRVGTLLGRAVARAGWRLVAVAGGSEAAREGLCRCVAGARPTATPAEAAARAELLLLCVPDDALEQVATDLAVSGALGEGHRVVHVAGSVGLAPLRRVGLTGAGVAACHPAMTVPAGAQDPDLLVGVAWAVTARPTELAWAEEFVTRLGGDPHEVADDVRGLYHAGLAVGSNAVGAAVATARQLVLAAGIERPDRFLAPLIDASVANVLAAGAQALTGPIVRGDTGTVARHLDHLGRDLPELLPAYRALARATLATVRASLSSAAVTRFDELLHDPEA